jgi:hypothetical protein
MAIEVFMKVARATAAHSNSIVRENQNELAPRLLQEGDFGKGIVLLQEL